MSRVRVSYPARLILNALLLSCDKALIFALQHGYNMKRPWVRERTAHGRRNNPNALLYNNKAWRKMSLAQRTAYPLCAHCLSQGRTRAATVADHIVPINQGGGFMDASNLQSLCNNCHNRKSGTESMPHGPHGEGHYNL